MSLLQKLINNIIPTARADDEDGELVDPQKVLREVCKKQPKCIEFQTKLNTCNDRVNSRRHTEETCLEELIDYVECVDHCVGKTLFDKLK